MEESKKERGVRPAAKPLIEGVPSCRRTGRARITQKQKLFADEYLLHGNRKLAGEKVGFSDNHARDTLKAPAVRRYIGEAQARTTKDTIASRAERLAILSGIVRGETDAKQDQVMAAKLMAQMEGELVHRIGGPGGGAIEIAAMSTHELLAVIARYK